MDLDAGIIALIKGWAINLGGGYHRASFDSGNGFCVYADLALCITHMRRYHGDKVKRVLILDVAAHQGSGIERDFMDDRDVCIIDCYNPSLYPFDFDARKAISFDIPVDNTYDDLSIIERLEELLPEVIGTFQPDFILYNAGTDCLAEDGTGGK